MAGLYEFIENLWITDSHEHTVQEVERVSSEADPLQILLSQYASSDLISSGLSLEDYVRALNLNVPLKERWRLIEPFWDKAKNTTYFEVIKIALNDLYDISELDENTIEVLAEKMRSLNKIGFYKWVLKDKAKIRISIFDGIADIVDVDREFFVPVVRLEDFILLRSREDVRRLSKSIKIPIHSLKGLESALESKVQSIINKIVGFKIALAYRRDIHFEKVTFNDAERVFNKIMSYERTFIRYTSPDGIRLTMSDEISVEESLPLQDYMVHKILEMASKYKLPVQVHTGLQEGNLNLVSNSNPLHLANLFMEYYDVKFDIFHGAYPYVRELAVLAKNFPNVYVDLCWLHAVSSSSVKYALNELLDMVPANKIIGFGGDYKHVEGVYGHSRLARKNVAEVLQDKVDRGHFSLDEAENIAKMLLHDNLLEVFRLSV
ncbi:MAG: amidohydrolase [Nitrososphaeria archaeon]|nr:amidohydrolase [Nitrososphaeria archaeon]